MIEMTWLLVAVGGYVLSIVYRRYLDEKIARLDADLDCYDRIDRMFKGGVVSDITRGILEFVCEEHDCALEFNSDPSGRITPLKAIAGEGPYMFDLRENSGLICPTNWKQTEERGGDEAPDFEDFFGSCKPKWRVRLSDLFSVAAP